ncbi:hypothetical protein BZL29_0657 [Mycobacterium kansasii]|uniref:Uncharacterized protein n=1 Tax=Mycobacterium kansasii TaxID=1768 RepID=A0A1V3XZL0_MYCKA|nr:hypothetical protein BZL29_0657 [Mycobacterium kansasii]
MCNGVPSAARTVKLRLGGNASGNWFGTLPRVDFIAAPPSNAASSPPSGWSRVYLTVMWGRSHFREHDMVTTLNSRHFGIVRV